MKITPLFPIHRQEGAKMAPFAGWEMPLEYGGILAEHRAVRSNQGLFDLSHMGEIEVSGPDAPDFLQELIVSDLFSRRPGQALYTVMCREDGGILDDLVVYLFAEKFWLVVNAANTAKIFDWMKGYAACRRVVIQNQTDPTALLAVQGPGAEEFLRFFCAADLSALPYYHFLETKIGSVPAVISRTGYTGEDGFEIFTEASAAPGIWRAFRGKGIVPAGLGARDVLRLEAGYLLYGNDMDETTSPLEVGLSWVVNFDKDRFTGKEALLKQKQEGVARRPAAFVMEDRSVPRRDYPLLLNGKEAGRCTSGTFSPVLAKGIGMGLVESSKAAGKFSAGDPVGVMIRGTQRPARIVRKPFVRGSVKCGS